jgi:dTDP-glucose pyrophosphorylase
MNIIIPLGGKGERFKNDGYLEPKPLIKVLDKEILFHVIDNLNLKDNRCKIFIIYNKDLDDFNFKSIINNKYSNIILIKLDNDTKGASETIYIGLSEIIKNYKFYNKTLLIDGDTFYTDDIITKFKNCNNNCVFYIKNSDPLPVFSYLELDKNNIITDIKEKIKISDNANTGAYAFNNIKELYNYSKLIVDDDIRFNGECYTSCIIHLMIKNNIKFEGIEVNVENVHVLGTPKQVKEFLNLNSINI